MKNQLLLLEDVDNVGRSGEVVSVRPGYARNFLLPQQLAIIADKNTLRLQAKLQEERAKRAAIDLKEAEELKQQIEGRNFTIEVKVDPEGHMYGSVSVSDLIDLVGKEGIALEKKNIAFSSPLKSIGKHEVPLKLKEGVRSFFTLTIESDIPLPSAPKVEEKQEATPEVDQEPEVGSDERPRTKEGE